MGKRTLVRLAPIGLALGALTSACLAPEFRIANDDGSSGGGSTDGSGGDDGGGGTSGGTSSGGTNGGNTGGTSTGSGAASGVGGTSAGGGPGSGGGSSGGGSSSGGGTGSGGGFGSGGAPGPAVLTGVETVGIGCQLPTLKTYAQLDPFAPFPNPFVLESGNDVETLKDWECRHREIRAMIEGYETGYKPLKPSSVTGSVSGSTLTVSFEGGSGAGSFSAAVEYPTNGATAPFPAMIVLGESGLSAQIRSLGVATITLDVEGQIRPLDDRDAGIFSTFTNLNGAGALLAWAWGASRVIDALEATPDADIDATHVGVTGCPHGMASLVVGALDARIGLTIVQDPGAGGVAPWRAAEYEANDSFTDAVYDNEWFALTIETFTEASVDLLPYDRHSIVSLLAPRGLLTLASDNVSFLPYATAQGMHLGRDAFQALGVSENIGFLMGTHSECAVTQGSTEYDAVADFVGKFLVGTGVSTGYWDTDIAEDSQRWRSWYVPSPLPAD